MKGIRVTVLDLESGETETKEVAPGDYLMICTNPCYVWNTQVYPKSGTHVLTVKGRLTGRVPR